MIPPRWDNIPDWQRIVALQVNEILRGYPFPMLDTAPPDPTAGLTYYDTVLAQVRTWNGSSWVSGGGGGTTANPLTMNNGGAGAASGTTFDGSVARTISYNTVGAAASSHTHAQADVTNLVTDLAAKQPLDADLTAYGAVGNGIVTHTGAGTASARTITAGTGISVVDGDGVAGNPTVAVSMPAAMTLISEQTPSGTGTVTFSSIAATYRDLRLVIRGRGTSASASVAVTITFNNDTGANYDYERVSAVSNAVSAIGLTAQNSINFGGIAAASATADVADAMIVDIFDYRGTTFQKAANSRSGTKTGTAAANLATEAKSGWWRSTAAINRVDVILSAGNFTTGSVVSLYGVM